MKYTLKKEALNQSRKERGMSWEELSIFATPDGKRDRLKNCAYKGYQMDEEEARAVAERLGKRLKDIADTVQEPERQRPTSAIELDQLMTAVDLLADIRNELLVIRTHIVPKRELPQIKPEDEE